MRQRRRRQVTPARALLRVDRTERLWTPHHVYSEAHRPPHLTGEPPKTAVRRLGGPLSLARAAGPHPARCGADTRAHRPDPGRARRDLGVAQVRGACAPHHPVLDTFCRKEGFGRTDPWVTRLTWRRKPKGTTAGRERGRRPAGVYGADSQDPRDTAKGTLLEAQFLATHGYVPRPPRLVRGHQYPMASRSPSQPSGWWAVISETTEGNGQAAYVTLGRRVS